MLIVYLHNADFALLTDLYDIGGCSHKFRRHCETCTMPSLPGNISTNAPNGNIALLPSNSSSTCTSRVSPLTHSTALVTLPALVPDIMTVPSSSTSTRAPVDAIICGSSFLRVRSLHRFSQPVLSRGLPLARTETMIFYTLESQKAFF